MAFEFTFVTAAWILYAAASSLLAAVVLRTRPSSIGNVALGAFLLQQAGATVAMMFLNSAETLSGLHSAFNVGTFFWLLWTPVLFAVVPSLLHGTARERPAWIVGGVAAAPALVMLAAWFVAPSFVFLGDGLALTMGAVGSLSMAFVGFATAVGFLAWEAYATPMPLRRGRFALLAMAFGGEGSYHAVQNAAQALSHGTMHGAPLDSPAAWALVLLPVALFAALLAAAGTVAWRDLDADRRRWARRLVAVLAVGSAAGAIAAPLMSQNEMRHPSGIFHALLDLAFLCLVFFAAMRYQLFTLERRAQVSVAIAVAVFLGACLFVAAEQFASDYLQERFSNVLPNPGYAAAFVVTGATVPLHRVGMKVGRKIFPNVTKTIDYERQRAEDIYRAAVEGALLDGVKDPTEVRSLARLRETLKITDADARRIELSIVAVVAAPAGVAPA